MGVGIVRNPVRGPARVRDADGSAEVLTLEEMFQVRDLAFAFENVEGPRCVDQRDSRTVVTPVFEAVQTLHQNRTGITPADISYNSAHLLFRYLSGLKIVKYFTNIRKKRAGIYTRLSIFWKRSCFSVGYLTYFRISSTIPALPATIEMPRSRRRSQTTPPASRRISSAAQTSHSWSASSSNRPAALPRHN